MDALAEEDVPALPPVRAFDADLPRRVAAGLGGAWEARQIEGLMAWMDIYERALRHIAVHGTGEAAMVAARALVGDWAGDDGVVSA